MVERDGWVIGRKGDGYVALWSCRPDRVAGRTTRPPSPPTGLTERFDLVAPGGADNVWITEVGRAADWADAPDPFAAFVDAITAAEIEVVPLAAEHEVRYQSPTTGTVVLHAANTSIRRPHPRSPSTAAPIGLTGYPRHATPWSQAEMGGRRYEVTADGWTLTLDFETATRTSASP